MRTFLLFILLSMQLNGISADASLSHSKEFKIIKDSVYLQDGSSCHIDNFSNGICEMNDSWWDINYLSFWTGLLIPFVFFGYLAINIKRKINKRRRG